MRFIVARPTGVRMMVNQKFVVGGVPKTHLPLRRLEIWTFELHCNVANSIVSIQMTNNGGVYVYPQILVTLGIFVSVFGGLFTADAP